MDGFIIVETILSVVFDNDDNNNNNNDDVVLTNPLNSLEHS